MKLYICKSGEALSKAEEYRANYIRLKTALFAVAKTFGADQVRICDTMMLLDGIKIKGDVPEGWMSPRWLNGALRPKKIKENANILKHFTPGGSYSIKRHRDLQKIFDWMNTPHWYKYTTKDGSEGRSSISCGWFGPQILWFSEKGPLAITLPDMEKIKAQAIAEGIALTCNALDWTPPEGMVLSSDEEWEYLTAKHKFESKDVKP